MMGVRGMTSMVGLIGWGSGGNRRIRHAFTLLAIPLDSYVDGLRDT